MRQDVATRAWAKSPQKRGSPPFSHFVAPAAGRWPAIEFAELHCALEPLARARRRRRQRPWRCSWRRLSPARGGARCRAHRDRTEREPLARRAEAPISTNADLRSSKPLARARRRLVNILARTIQVLGARPNAHEAEPRNLPQPRRQRRCFSRISASRMAASITDEATPRSRCNGRCTIAGRTCNRRCTLQDALGYNHPCTPDRHLGSMDARLVSRRRKKAAPRGGQLACFDASIYAVSAASTAFGWRSITSRKFRLAPDGAR